MELSTSVATLFTEWLLVAVQWAYPAWRPSNHSPYPSAMIAIKRLHDLQEIDLGIAERDASLADVCAKLADDSGIASTRQKIARLDAKLSDLGSKRRAAERAIAEIQEDLKRIEARLYGGAVKNPRELEAAEEERAFRTSQQRDHEDVLLDLMVETDDAETLLGELQGALERIEAARPQQVAELTRSKDELEWELALLQEERDQTAPEIPPDLYRIYESLRRSKNGHAVARVERGHVPGLSPLALHDGAATGQGLTRGRRPVQ